jgi:hypothetical protein
LTGEQVLAAALGPGEAVGVDLAEAVVEVEQVLVDLERARTASTATRGSRAPFGVPSPQSHGATQITSDPSSGTS